MGYAWKNMTKDQRIAMVAPLTAEGYSASQIAERVGTTRNAVIGLWTRNPDLIPKPEFGTTSNKAKRDQIIQKRRLAREERQRVEEEKARLAESRAAEEVAPPKPAPKLSGGFKFGFQGTARQATRPEPMVIPVVEFVPETTEHPTITTVGFGQCRLPQYDRAQSLPLSEHFVCGAEVVVGTSWCPEHHARVFQPVARRREATRKLMKMASL